MSERGIFMSGTVLKRRACIRCLLYTSDAADEYDGVDLGGRRIIKKIFFKQKTAYAIVICLVGSEMCIRDRVWLGVWEHNERARHFYERYGFKKAGTHTFTIGPDQQTDFWYARSMMPAD